MSRVTVSESDLDVLIDRRRTSSHRSPLRATHACFMELGVALALTAAVFGNGGDGATAGPDANEVQRTLAMARERFEALPVVAAEEEEKASSDVVELGRKLFFDPRLSVDGTVSCARCHQAGLSATDGLPNARGARDVRLPRNAPTVLNATLNFRQHWRGEFATLEDQALGALDGKGFGNADLAAAVDRIKAVPGYAALFETAFPDAKEPVTAENGAKAIASFERTLLTPSRFDEFLREKTEALSDVEQEGLRKFVDIGCADCHDGANVGGGSFEKFGIYSDYWKATGSRTIDDGRFSLTNDPKDKYVFKVPGLRNVAATPPYFHDGSVERLPEAVRIMAKAQLNQDLSQGDVESIVTFLRSLSGSLPERYARSPELPVGGFVPPVSRSDQTRHP